MTALYDPNSDLFDEIMQSDEIAGILRTVVDDAKEYAESISPVRTGTYRNSFTTSVEVVGDRQEAILANTADYAAVIEVKQRVLGRTVDYLESAGLAEKGDQ